MHAADACLDAAFGKGSNVPIVREVLHSVKMPVEVGIGTAIKKREKSFPFLTIIPQAPKFGWGAGSEGGKLAHPCVARIEAHHAASAR